MIRRSAAHDDSSPATAYDGLPSMRPRPAVRSVATGDLSSARLVLHTVQTADAWSQLAATGCLRPDRSLEEPDFGRAYEWMGRQMADRALPGDGMIWLWARIGRRDLRDLARRGAGRVLLTVEVSADRVLLSHFADWHCVLNDGPLLDPYPGESEAAFGRRWNGVDEAGPAAVAATWQAVFDRRWWSDDAQIQATIREVRADDVVRAVRLLPPRGPGRGGPGS